MSVIENTKKGTILRVRLTPNSSSCKTNGIFTDADGMQYLKINVISVPEKGKANQELVCFLAKQLKTAKSTISLISGETDRMKKLLLDVDYQKIEQWLEKENNNE